MTTVELLNLLRERGITLWAKDGELRYQAASWALNSTLEAELIKHKIRAIGLVA